MKKKFFFIPLLAFILFTFAKVAPDTQGATVQKMSGVSMFILSEPKSEYIILGTAQVRGIVSSSKADHMADLLVRQVKKDYPSAQGVLVSDLTFERGEAIIFK